MKSNLNHYFFKILALSLFFYVGAFPTQAQRLSIHKSPMEVETTFKQIINEIKSQKLVYFETVWHDKIAMKKGIKLPPMREILFEDANLTTKLIKCQPTCAIDLPMKILVWEENKDTYIGFINPDFMKKEYVNVECEGIIDEMGKQLKKITVNTLRSFE